MENVLYLEKEEENRKKGLIVSVIAHILLLLLCFFPYMSIDKPAQPISGILVSLGTPEGGNSADIAASAAVSEAAEDAKPSEPVEATAPKETAPTPEPVEKTPEKVEPTPEPVQEKILTQESENPIVKETTEAEKKKKEAAEKAAEAEEKRKAAEAKAAEEARKAAEEKAAKEAAAKAAKQSYSDLFGSGRGENNNSGNQGDPAGDPNSDNLKGIATGSGRIGGGLSDRGVLFEPAINDNTQKTGKVVIKVCVDSEGKVSEAKFTQRGSTTTDSYLVSVAEKAAKKYKFTTATVDTQCGTITVDFKVGK